MASSFHLPQEWRRGQPAALLLAIGMVAVPACDSERARIEPPSLSPGGAAQQALAEYDLNHDGFLDANELSHCPALKNSLAELDKDGDGRLSADEIAQRITFYQESRVGLRSVNCKLLLDGKPLAGASVNFVPEPFLGSAMKKAVGISNKNGTAVLYAEGERVQGVQCGFYRVVISKKDGAGQELLPARYNTDTTLGHEVSPDMRSGITFRLSGQ
jgi:hypothetical protein